MRVTQDSNRVINKKAKGKERRTYHSGLKEGGLLFSHGVSEVGFCQQRVLPGLAKLGLTFFNQDTLVHEAKAVESRSLLITQQLTATFKMQRGIMF